MDEIELAQAEAELVQAGRARHRVAGRNRGSSSVLATKLQWNRLSKRSGQPLRRPTTAKTSKKAVRKAVAKCKAMRPPTRAGKGELCPRQFYPTPGARIVTASDCSGLDTVTAALKIAGLQPCTLFLSEKDKQTRQVLESNYATGGAYAGIGGVPHAGSDGKPVIFNNIMTRDDSKMISDNGAEEIDVDLYTAGPPCQPFSNAGEQKGLTDPRAHVLLRVLQTIKTIQPLTFALENVKPLARHKKFKNLFAFILAFLRSIEDAYGQRVYQVEWKVL